MQQDERSFGAVEKGYLARLKEIRRRTGKSQEMVAAELGVSKTTYSSWETGRNRFAARYVIPLCEALGCTANDIFGYPADGDVRFAMVEDIMLDDEFMDFARLWRRSAPNMRKLAFDLLSETAKRRTPRPHGPAA